MRTINAVLLIACAMQAPLCAAQDAAPDVLLNKATVDVITVIKQGKTAQATNTAKIAAVIGTSVLPLFDFSRKTRNAVARIWSLASPEQRNALVAEFKTLLVRTYSTALVSYHNQVITFKALRVAPGDTDVTVKLEVKRSGAEKVSMNYAWKRFPPDGTCTTSG